ncbi:hypothetical protein PR048_019103 [Dryococelus australis]|uniref:Uncharacterized protein n=1 Tax=Dryococelus australis TaxID=614101 RepID=A0ABQ9H2M6_9NEOP|nr:hypothetical protein PR048_019103 [Dryococelus australis]
MNRTSRPIGFDLMKACLPLLARRLANREHFTARSGPTGHKACSQRRAQSIEEGERPHQRKATLRTAAQLPSPLTVSPTCQQIHPPSPVARTVAYIASDEIWAALNSEVLRADEDSGVRGRRKREIPEKTRRPAIPSCENPRMTRSGIEPRFTLVRGVDRLKGDGRPRTGLSDDSYLNRERGRRAADSRENWQRRVSRRGQVTTASRPLTATTHSRHMLRSHGWEYRGGHPRCTVATYCPRALFSRDVRVLWTLRFKRAPAVKLRVHAATRLDYSPPTEANRVRFPAGDHSWIFACGKHAGRCRCSGISCFLPPFIPALSHSSPRSQDPDLFTHSIYCQHRSGLYVPHTLDVMLRKFSLCYLGDGANERNQYITADPLSLDGRKAGVILRVYAAAA